MVIITLNGPSCEIETVFTTVVKLSLTNGQYLNIISNELNDLNSLCLERVEGYLHGQLDSEDTSRIVTNLDEIRKALLGCDYPDTLVVRIGGCQEVTTSHLVTLFTYEAAKYPKVVLTLN